MAKNTEHGTQPKLQSEGFSTRGHAKENLGNNPRGTEFTGICYAGKLQPEPSSPGRGSSKK
jgi:hypothetical protein